MNEREQLEQAIAMQDTLRGEMPDAVIDTTIKALQTRLAALEPVALVELEKHGDAVIALWGVERAREDDPEQAIRAALTMQTIVSAFSAEHDVLLTLYVIWCGIITACRLSCQLCEDVQNNLKL